jgi:hypothetical protein
VLVSLNLILNCILHADSICIQLNLFTMTPLVVVTVSLFFEEVVCQGFDSYYDMALQFSFTFRNSSVFTISMNSKGTDGIFKTFSSCCHPQCTFHDLSQAFVMFYPTSDVSLLYFLTMLFTQFR